MEETKKIQTLKDVKFIAIVLYEIYMAQSIQDNVETNCYHENETIIVDVIQIIIITLMIIPQVE